MNTKDETEKAWEYQSNRRWHEKEANPKAFEDPYIQGIVDFKASLREEIEKEKVVRGVHGHYADGRTWAFEKCLELLDTVKPSTSQPEGNTVNQQKH